MESVEPVCPQQLLGYMVKLSCTSKLLAMISGVCADSYSTQGEICRTEADFPFPI